VTNRFRHRYTHFLVITGRLPASWRRVPRWQMTSAMTWMLTWQLTQRVTRSWRGGWRHSFKSSQITFRNRHRSGFEFDTKHAFNCHRFTITLVTEVQIIFEFEFAKDTRMTTQFHRLIKAEFATKWTTQNWVHSITSHYSLVCRNITAYKLKLPARSNFSYWVPKMSRQSQQHWPASLMSKKKR